MSADPQNPQGRTNENWTSHEYDWDRGGYTPPPGGPQDYQYRGPGSQEWGRTPYPGEEYHQPASGPVPGYSRDMSPGDEKTWAVLAHVAAPLGALLSAGWLGFVGPLVIWLMYRDRSGFVRAASARSFNFNIVLIVGNAVAWVLFISLIGIPIAIVMWIALFIGMLVFHISAALDASKGILYRYPLDLKLLQ